MVNRDHINEVLVSHNDCRKRPTVHRFRLNGVIVSCTNLHDDANKEARIDLFIRAKATTATAYQCSLSRTMTTKNCGYKSNTNHYHGPKSYYQRTMLRYRAVTRSDCQRHVRNLQELWVPRFNRPIEPPQHFAFLTDSEQQNNLNGIHSLMQATSLDQDVYGVWVYWLQSQSKTWIPDGTTN